MSRLSRANLKARESIFAGGPELYRGDIQAICPPNLEECVAAMEDCCEESYEVQMLVRSGTKDLPRMAKIISNERIFILANEEIVRRYKRDLADEIEPSINELIARAEQGLQALEKKENQLKLKLELAKAKPARPGVGSGASAAQKAEARRLQMLIKQRERLEEEERVLEEEVKALELKSLER
ncbi:hypothetical protein BDQ17DRAFT_1352330 [Cyathus striatus]|nr:hypothetical protein BDQ17DRAFT_1352330 [Cyathus striatus]